MKKIFYLVFSAIFLIICVNIINAEEKECTYYSFSSKSKKTFSFSGECPVVVNGIGQKVDLSKTKLEETDGFYLLEGYTLSTGSGRKPYDDSHFYFAQINYKMEQVKIGVENKIINFIFFYDRGELKLSNSENVTIANRLVWENFLTDDRKQFYSPIKLKVGLKYENSSLGYMEMVLENDSFRIPGMSTEYVNLESSFAIYKDEIDRKVLQSENYCGQGSFSPTFSAKLYDDGSAEFFNDSSGTIINANILPDYIYAKHDSGDKYLISYDEIDGWDKYYKCDVQGSDESNEDFEILDGTKFKELLGALNPPLKILAPQALNYNLIIDGQSATLNDVTPNDNVCNETSCSLDALGFTEKAIKDIRQYCVVLNNRADELDDDPVNFKKRKDECNGFNEFYGKLIANGIVHDLSEGCSILSDDLKNKLVWILDIIKIAGPILALGLGTLDFIKVLANGDADKEMKNAFKRFMIRLGAAALLFIIPLILAFLLDVFLGNQDGYNSDNPFCVEIDWNE